MAPSTRSAADTAFGRQLALDDTTPDGSQRGRFATTISEEWNCPLVPHGGLMTAVACAAMERSLDEPNQRLRSVTAVFAAQVRPGPVEIETTVLRRGRSMSQLSATVRNSDEASGHTVVAVFGAERPGFSFTEPELPKVPPAPDCPSFRDRTDAPSEDLHFNFWDQVEGRSAVGHPPWAQWEPTVAESINWYRFDEMPLSSDGGLHPLALVTLCDTMPGAVRERIGPTAARWLPPSADLTVHILDRCAPGWVLGHNRARHAGDGYASVEMELWDPAGVLVAYATQTMFFSFVG